MLGVIFNLKIAIINIYIYIMKDHILQNKRKIFIAAFAIAFVSVQAVTRLKKVVKLRAEVA
jgi:hypothetical protein